MYRPSLWERDKRVRLYLSFSFGEGEEDEAKKHYLQLLN